MPKKKKRKTSGLPHFFQNTRTGFYTLVVTAAILMLTTMNMYGSANFERDVLGESDSTEESQKERKQDESERREKEERQEKEEQEKREERERQKEKIQQKYNVSAEKIKIEYEYENADTKVKRKVEFKDKEQEIEEEIEEELSNDIEKNFEDENETEIASDSSSVTITKNKIKARSGFPLSIDGATNQLIVTRPDGTQKVVAILPDQAVENFIRHKKVNLINFEDPGSTPSAEPGDDSASVSAENSDDNTQITLVEHEDQLAYEIKGKKKLKLFGFFPVTTPTTGYVSAETGDVIDQEESLLTKLLDLISP